MTIISGIVTYIIIWWVVLFAVLPWGISTILRPLSGHASSAPEKPRLLLKFSVTSLITLILWGSFWGFHIPEKIHHHFLGSTLE